MRQWLIRSFTITISCVKYVETPTPLIDERSDDDDDDDASSRTTKRWRPTLHLIEKIEYDDEKIAFSGMGTRFHIPRREADALRSEFVNQMKGLQRIPIP